MKKIALDMESLSVESFATTPAAQDVRGTVKGHTGDDCYRVTQDAACGPYTTTPEPTAGGTCGPQVCIPFIIGAAY